jgi:hypothetical protein
LPRLDRLGTPTEVLALTSESRPQTLRMCLVPGVGASTPTSKLTTKWASAPEEMSLRSKPPVLQHTRRRCAKLFSAVASDATAATWNFGLRATRSREPRQARKGATVPGKPSVPRRLRSSSTCTSSDSAFLCPLSYGVRDRDISSHEPIPGSMRPQHRRHGKS